MRHAPAVLPLLMMCCSCAARADQPARSPATHPLAAQPATLFDDTRHMRTSEVESGMTGYGLSVFHGTKIERFDVEVISVLKNQMGPDQDIVLIRCRGQNLEHSGAVAGMSGSPIYLKDKQGRERMIGAFALGWEFSKDPIAGVRPIAEMLAVPTAKQEKPATAAAQGVANWDTRAMVRAAMQPQSLPALDAAAQHSSATPRLKRLSLPLVASGASHRFVEQTQSLVNKQGGLTLLQSGSVGDAPANDANAKLEPGAAIGIPVIRGDLDLAAIGTVTEVIGDRVFAFGHEFNSEGAVELPMGVGYVHTVIPNTNMSFKLGALLRTDGAIHSDEAVAVAGLIGNVPAMIPIEVAVTTPQRPGGQTYRFDIVRHPRFTPMASMMAISAAVLGHSQLPEEFSIEYGLTIEFENGQKLDLKNMSTSLTQAAELARDSALPIQMAMENPFGETYVKRITGKVAIEPAARLAVLETVQPAKTIYKPGETVRAFVTTRLWKGPRVTRDVEFKLPDELPDGQYTLTIADAARHVMDQTRFTPYRFHASNLEDVFDVTRELTRFDSRTLYMRLGTQSEALSVGRQPLAKLPESKRRVLGQPGRADVLQYTPSYTSSTRWEMPVSGAVDLELTIARDPTKASRPAGTGVPIITPQAPQRGPERPQEQQPQRRPTPDGH